MVRVFGQLGSVIAQRRMSGHFHCLKTCLSLLMMGAKSEGSGETVQIHSVALALTVRIYVKPKFA